MVRRRQGRYLAEHIPGARYVELAGADHLGWIGDQDALLDEVEEFLVGSRRRPRARARPATVLFTDIVGSTETAASSATAAGATCSSATTRSFAGSSRSTAAAR